MIKLPSAKVYSKPVSVSNPGQSLKCVKVTTLGPRTLEFCKKYHDKLNGLNFIKLTGMKSK